MDSLSQLWQQVEAYWGELPPIVREPPGLYVLWALAAFALYTLLIGWKPRRRHLAERLAEVDVSEMVRQGNYREAGRHLEAVGKKSKALELYHQGQCHAEEAALLLEMGKRSKAKELARSANLHNFYAELCRQDGELEAAAIAFERDGQVYQAANCYEQAGDLLRAARCYLAANLEGRAVAVLAQTKDPQAANLVEEAIRLSLKRAPGIGLSVELAQAVRRTVQTLLSSGQAERAFRLAVDAGEYEVAVPIARDYLPASENAAAVCIRAGAPLVAAEIYKKLGKKREEALQRAEHHLKAGQTESAAAFFEEAEELSQAAELWLSQGELHRAADLFSRSGNLVQAADIYGQLGDFNTQKALMLRLQTQSIRAFGDIEPTLREGGSVLAGNGGLPTATVSPSQLGQTQGGPPQPADTAPLFVGGRYRLAGELGRGGMGIVYKAEDTVLHREVAYKVLPPYLFGRDQNPDALLAEARAAARLSHPNIVQVYDAGRDENGFFVVMELVRGQGLDATLAERTMTIKGILMVAQQICAALAHAHERRIVHRDLKPSNLIWNEADKQVKLTDFGLARIVEDSGKVQTQAAGTPSYMAPEQIRGEAVGPACDLYALGCLLFEMSCRRSVFGSGPRSLHAHLNNQPDDPRGLRPDLPAPLAELILACLAKDQAERPSSAAEIGKRLQAMLTAK